MSKVKSGRGPKAQSPKPVVGIIGLGIMGSAMAANTVRGGYTVIGYDVDAARVRDHMRAGGIAARSSADVRKRADIVICSLPSAAALGQVAAELADSDGAEIVVETSTPDKREAGVRRATSCAAGPFIPIGFETNKC